MLNDPFITFEVRYRLREYLSLVSAHAQSELARRRHADGKPLRKRDLLGLRLSLWLLAPPIFAFKTSRLGACRFSIDRDGIVRGSKMGEMVMAWSDVRAVHEYPTGYLIAKDKGALPVPYRVLNAQQRRLLQSFIANAGLSQAALLKTA